MDACHHATAGTGLDAFILWASDSPALKGKIPDIRERWNRIRPDHGLTAHHLARELRLHGDNRLEAKLAQYEPRSINMTLRSMIAKVREPMDAHRVIDELAKFEGMHPYQINTVLSKLAKKTNQKITILHDLYDGAVLANTRHGVDWPHYTISKAGAIRLQPTYENFKVLLKKSRIEIKYNLLHDTTDIFWPDMNRTAFRITGDENFSEIASRCAIEKLAIPQALLREYIKRYANEPGHNYHPVHAWLESKTWDGLDRWPAFMAQLDLYNITSDAAGAFLRRWFFMALDGLYKPKGVEKSSLLVLIGPSGIGKTLFFRSLVPEIHADNWLTTGWYWPESGKRISNEWIRYTNQRWMIEIKDLRWRDLCDPSRFREYLSRNVDRYIYNPWHKTEKLRYRRTVFYANISTPKDMSKPPTDDIFLGFAIHKFTPDLHLDMHQFWLQLKVEYVQIQ